MADREILIKITNDKIWFNDTNFIAISCTDIPCKHLTFNYHREIHWKVEMKYFDKTLNHLSVEITNYNHIGSSEFFNQRPKKLIKSLEFGVFNWRYLEPLLSSYQRNKFINKLTDTNSKSYDYTSRSEKLIEDGLGFSKIEISKAEATNSKKETTFTEEFAINFSDSIFLLGYIRFSKNIKQLNQTLEFKIANDDILPEFDNIKYWFSKKLKIRNFKVKAIFNLVNNELIEYKATSKDIDNIDQGLIEGVKVLRTLEITRSHRPEGVDKALFTSEDLYSLDAINDLEGNVFKQTEKDILDMLIEKCEVRNKRELTYLSGSKQSLNYRIRFTNHPNFGFIFLAEGDSNNHFIWELLNTNATYIWTIEKGQEEIKLQYNRIESSINTILDCGREKYKRAYRTTNLDNDLILNVINHKDKGSKFIDEFPRWKYRINELIT